MVQLTQSQQEATQWVREQSALDYRTNPRVIVVGGLSGAGKSTVVASLQDELKAAGHLLLNPEELRFPQDVVENAYSSHHGQIVVAAGIHEAAMIQGTLDAICHPADYDIYDVNWNTVPKRRFVSFPVKGMTEEEMRAYIQTIPRTENTSSLPLDDIVACSLGLPALARELLDIPHLSLPLAQRIAALHLYHNGSRRREVVPSLAAQYLQILPDPAILEMISNGMATVGYARDAHIYHRLPKIKQHYAYMEDGVSAYFVAPESVDMYTEALRKHLGNISITIPWLTAEQSAVVADVLGFNLKDKSSRTPRWRMFDLDRKELTTYGFFPDGREKGMSEWEELPQNLYRYSRIRRAVLDRLRETGVLLSPSVSGSGFFVVSANDHGAVNEQPLNLGWMLESFLQQKGIAYLGWNSIHRNYFYDPTKQKVTLLDEEPSFSFSTQFRKIEEEVGKTIPHVF